MIGRCTSAPPANRGIFKLRARNPGDKDFQTLENLRARASKKNDKFSQAVMGNQPDDIIGKLLAERALAQSYVEQFRVLCRSSHPADSRFMQEGEKADAVRIIKDKDAKAKPKHVAIPVSELPALQLKGETVWSKGKAVHSSTKHFLRAFEMCLQGQGADENLTGKLISSGVLMITKWDRSRRRCRAESFAGSRPEKCW